MARHTLFAAAVVFVAGCAAREERGQVEGTVRRNGQPVANVAVVFLPEAGPGRATGRTDAQGRYQLQTDDGHDGAAVGAYRVVIEDLAVYAAPRSPDGTLLRKPAPRFAAHYTDPLRTPLRRDVHAGAQTVDLDLSDKP
jgi:hypothetical protein